MTKFDFGLHCLYCEFRESFCFPLWIIYGSLGADDVLTHAFEFCRAVRGACDICKI